MNYLSVYRQSSVNTASGPQLLLMLFDGLVRFVNQAIQCIQQNEIEGAHRAITRAQDIVVELRSTLKHEEAPELVESLDSLYRYFYSQLVEANVSKSTEPIEAIKPMIVELHEAFTEAAKQLTIQGGQNR